MRLLYYVGCPACLFTIKWFGTSPLCLPMHEHMTRITIFEFLAMLVFWEIFRFWQCRNCNPFKICLMIYVGISSENIYYHIGCVFDIVWNVLLCLRVLFRFNVIVIRIFSVVCVSKLIWRINSRLPICANSL